MGCWVVVATAGSAWISLSTAEGCEGPRSPDLHMKARQETSTPAITNVMTKTPFPSAESDGLGSDLPVSSSEQRVKSQRNVKRKRNERQSSAVCCMYVVAAEKLNHTQGSLVPEAKVVPEAPP